ncbi:hypothetical protein K438DRAFT_1760743 [Mycena galopus ATCC 62051]|nr:hypothetical protein K438DRAFT_1760743 [Mycena galopus ATCC 62051]
MSFALQRFPLGRLLSVTCVVWGGLVILQWFAFFLVSSSSCNPGLSHDGRQLVHSEMTSRSLWWLSMNALSTGLFALVIYALAKHAQDSGGLAAWRIINLYVNPSPSASRNLIRSKDSWEPALSCERADKCLILMHSSYGLALFILLGTSDEVRWLTPEQKQAAKDRIASNGTGVGCQKEWNWNQVRERFIDLQIWFFFFFYVIATIPTGSLATFGPLLCLLRIYESRIDLIRATEFYHDSRMVPLYGADHSDIPFYLVTTLSVLPSFIGLLCIGLLPDPTNKWVYWSNSQIYSIPAVWTLIPVNVAGRTKKTIVGTQVFCASDAPRYIKGLTAISVVFGVAYYNLENARRDRERIAAGVSDLENDEISKQARLMDKTDLDKYESQESRFLAKG